jgi:OmcA/MtrC family decaheme c-type cytochrome
VTGPATPEYDSTPSAVLASGSAGHPDPLALTTVGSTDEYVYAFSTTAGAVPPSATGTWTVSMEGRRRKSVARYDPSTDTFRWPFTGETITEAPDNAFDNVDLAAGRCGPSPACPGGLAGGTAPRRAVVSEGKCLGCHGGRLELHGSLRNGIAGCVICHTAQATDWARRPKVSGLVNLAATLDGLEERSIHFKVLIHRIHTGARDGAATLAEIAPHVVYGYGGTPYFFDEVEYPADLRNCTLCHEGKSYLVDAVPAGAPPTVANETRTIRHAANGSAHAAGEPSRPPVQAACLGCHTGGASVTHAASKTVGGVETCTSCHTNGALAVEVVHGLAPATGAAAGTTFSSIVRTILVPRCATSACHAAGGTPPILEASAAYGQLVGAPSDQSSLKQVEPNQPERSYLVHKLRGTAASVSGSVATIMPTDGALAPADLAAIEAWIANGAPND